MQNPFLGFMNNTRKFDCVYLSPETMNKKNILLLTLVHPDFLPPVYAIAQVLRDLEYNIHILTFDSFVPSESDLGSNITLETIGNHHSADTFQRMKLRNKFTKRARKLCSENQPLAIISFCPFSFICGLSVKKEIPLLYIALEIADFVLSVFLKSPLSNYRNLQALNNIKKADLVATPSIQRSAWLAGRCHLPFMPYTILNTACLRSVKEENNIEVFKELVPAGFLNKKILLYTGAVNPDQCTLELVQAFDMANDEQSVLIITGIKDNAYCNAITAFAAKSASAGRIKLFPYLTRAQMLSLQANAHIGVCLAREDQSNIKSKMMAPNKAGEYLSKNLYLLGVSSEYMRPFETNQIATLAEAVTPAAICEAIKTALAAVNNPGYKTRIKQYVQDYFCMEYQLKPVISFLKDITKDH